MAGIMVMLMAMLIGLGGPLPLAAGPPQGQAVSLEAGGGSAPVMVLAQKERNPRAATPAAQSGTPPGQEVAQSAEGKKPEVIVPPVPPPPPAPHGVPPGPPPGRPPVSPHR
jgi:hypothetical protein